MGKVPSINSGRARARAHTHTGTCTDLHTHIDAYEYTCILTQAHTHSRTGTHAYLHRHTHMICADAHALHTGNMLSMSMKRKSMGWGVQVNIPSCSAASAFLSVKWGLWHLLCGGFRENQRNKRSKNYKVLVYYVLICSANSVSIFRDSEEWVIMISIRISRNNYSFKNSDG